MWPNRFEQNPYILEKVSQQQQQVPRLKQKQNKASVVLSITDHAC